MFKSYKMHQNRIKNLLMDNQKIQSLINKTAWHRVDIFNKVNNKRRMMLYLTKPEFMDQCREFINKRDDDDDIDLIPILMFNDNEYSNEFWIEHVRIVTI